MKKAIFLILVLSSNIIDAELSCCVKDKDSIFWNYVEFRKLILSRTESIENLYKYYSEKEIYEEPEMKELLKHLNMIPEKREYSCIDLELEQELTDIYKYDLEVVSEDHVLLNMVANGIFAYKDEIWNVRIRYYCEDDQWKINVVEYLSPVSNKNNYEIPVFSFGEKIRKFCK